MEHQRLPGFVGLSIPVAAPNDQVLLRSTRLAGTQQAVLCVARVDAGHWTLSRGCALRTNALVVTEALPSGEARTWLRTRGFPGAALTRKTLTRKQNNESRSGRERVAHAGREQVSCSSLANALDVSESPLAHLLRTDTTTRICLFTGKGGTGKTTTSAAVAHRLASAGLRTLVVSTDPAHSLGDALGVDLGTEAASLDELVLIEPASQGRSSVRGQVQRVAPNLDALEIDITAAAEEFKALISTQRLIDLNKLGLADVQELLDTVPPGADEFVALSLILDLLERYDRVVIDTAPSGHTLRLLSFPDFLDSFLGKLLQLRGKLGVILNTVSGSVNRKQWEEAASKIGTFQQRMQQLGSLLRDEKSTEIVVVTIATELAVRESLRLIDELTHKRSLSVSAVIVNMVLQPSAKGAYIHSMQSAQQEFLERLHQRLGATHGYDIVQVPIFDTEIRTVYGARAFAACLSPLWSDEKPRLRKVVLTAAKGGCGKTTTAGAIGVHLADTGQRTIVVSTDPAHSLGDLFDVKAPSGSYLNDVTLIAENLSILEVDAERALIEFRETLESLRSAKILGLDLDIGDLGNLFDALPPGIDELVALSRVVNLISSEYDHIVIDTAPTGHTLRLLAFPDFLDGLLGRILRLKSKLDGITQFFSGLGGRSDRTEPELTPAQRLSRFREQLMELRDLLHDPERSEVVLVTRPTYLNVVETERLAQALARQRIASHRLVINQVVPPTLRDLERFVHRLVREHGQQIERLQQALPSQTRRSDVSPLIVVPYFDREVRGEAGRSDGGLELFARYLFRDSASD